MQNFLSRFGSLVTGVLSGFDRLVFRGSLQPLIKKGGMFFFLQAAGIRLLDFGNFARDATDRVKEASLAQARRLHRPIQYLPSSTVNKEELARKLLAQHPIPSGLVCVFTSLEPCRTFEYHRSPDPEQRGLRLRHSKCLHLYQYYLHPRYGFLNARIQTWFPFNVQICMNGREWLAQQLDRVGLDYQRVDNCFPWLEDPVRAQRLMDAQKATPWARLLQGLARALNPLHADIFKPAPMDYYWTAYQSEWATDLMFQNPSTLGALYPTLVRHALLHFRSPDVMRFLAQKSHGNFTGEITSSFKDRAEGVRVKHWLRGNSVKMYDKAGSVLRVETTIGNSDDFKVFRPSSADPDGKLDWRPLRKGIADLHRRAQVSQRSNDAYLDALAPVADTTPCHRVFDAVSRPLFRPSGRRTRALRIGDPDDLALLQAVSRGEFACSGFRNRDILALLHPHARAASNPDRRRLAAKTGRLLRILRDHGLVRRVQKTHRYRLTKKGQLLTATVSATREANVKQLLSHAA